MMIQERREFKRSDFFLIVNFRQLKAMREFSYGITNNVSQEGIRVESQNVDHIPGEILDIELKHPHTELSVSIQGEIVWKKDGWYKCEIGIKLRENKINGNIFILISNITNRAVDNLSHHDNGGEEVRDRDKHIDSTNPVKSVEPSVKNVRIDNEISFFNEIDNQKISDKVYATIDGFKLEHRKKRQKCSRKIETPSKKEYGANIDGKLSKKTIINKPQKSNWTLMVMSITLVVVLSVTFIIKFDYIKKALPTSIQMVQFIFSHETAKKQDVSITDNAEANRQAILASVDTLQLSNNEEINNVPLTKESNSYDQNYKASYADNSVEEISQHVINKDDAEPHKLSMNEGISQINNLQETIIFNYDSDVVSPLLYSKIEKIVDDLLSDSERFVKVEGHTDNIGNKIYNIDLSMRRALSVKNILIQKGIDTERINIAHLGDASPVDSNSTESGRKNNRRVDMRIVSDIL